MKWIVAAVVVSFVIACARVIVNVGGRDARQDVSVEVEDVLTRKDSKKADR